MYKWGRENMRDEKIGTVLIRGDGSG